MSAALFASLGADIHTWLTEAIYLSLHCIGGIEQLMAAKPIYIYEDMWDVAPPHVSQEYANWRKVDYRIRHLLQMQCQEVRVDSSRLSSSTQIMASVVLLYSQRRWVGIKIWLNICDDKKSIVAVLFLTRMTVNIIPVFGLLGHHDCYWHPVRVWNIRVVHIPGWLIEAVDPCMITGIETYINVRQGDSLLRYYANESVNCRRQKIWQSMAVGRACSKCSSSRWSEHAKHRSSFGHHGVNKAIMDNFARVWRRECFLSTVLG